MTAVSEENPIVGKTRPWRPTLSRASLVVLAVLYGCFRYAAGAMEHSHFAGAIERPVAGDGETLMTYQSGEEAGQPVIFVHGSPGRAGDWADFVEHPEPGLRVIAVDRPGYGESTPRGGLPRLEDDAAALRPLLESLRGRGPILVGHSLGGPIIVQTALDYPDLVGGLVIAAGALDPSVEKVLAIQYLGDLPGLRLLAPRFLRNSNYELLPLRQDLERLFPRLEEVACPVTIIHGTEDMLVPFKNVAYMQAAIPEGAIHEVMALEGENHFLPWTSEEAIWQAVAGMAEKIAL